MKLISKTLLYYLLICLPLLVLSGFLSYFLIAHELKEGLDESLWKEKLHFEKIITRSSNPDNLNTDELTHISRAPDTKEGYTFRDSLSYDSLEKEWVNYRILSAYYKFNDQNYKIEIARPTMEEEELAESLLSTFAIIGFFLLLSFFSVNLLISKTLWKPFYNTLGKLNDYQLKHQDHQNFEHSATEEFNKLNEALNKMIQKIRNDFLLQKEFTENASHEMQTPLAVINANVNLLMQSPNLKAEEMNQLQAIDNTTKKLASLNKSLLLLSKIDNKQFKETANIDAGAILIKTITHFDDLTEAKKISIENRIISSLSVSMNPGLSDVLFSNLVQNAIRHNFTGGKIILELSGTCILISNTGEPLKLQEEDLFARFKKNEASKDSLGLGLAIVRSICILYGIEIDYNYQDRMHTFKLKFPGEGINV